ncbi:MAG: Ig-like domain-containing protein, partial [Massilia sp.]
TADSDAVRVIKVDGTVVDSYDASTLADGSHTVRVVDTDGAGNSKSASLTFKLDTALTAPTVALATDSGQAGDGLTNQASLSFNTADSDAVRVIKVDGAVVNSYDASTVADGSHTVGVVDTDGAGNSKSASLTFKLDTTLTAPTVALATDSGQAGDGLTNQASLSFNTADSDAVRVIKVDGTVVDSYDASTLADGSHTVSVVDTDGAGNSKSASSIFTLDSKGPSFTSAAAVSVAENIGDNQIVYLAHATDEHFVVYNLNGDDASKFDISAAGVVTLKDNPNFEAINAYHFSVVATDAAGNHTDQAVSLAITNVNEAPVASPSSVSTVENTSITFQVSDFTYDQDAGDKLALSFNSNSATLTWANSDPNASTTLINPVTHAAVNLSSLNVQASISADGTTVTLAPPTELDWMVTGQVVKATFNYTVTDLGGLTSSNSINLIMTGSTTDKGLNLNGGNGNDTLSGNASNNAEDVLQGGNGNDTISGYGGTDALYGGNGDDKLFGGAGIDYLYGDGGNDTLDGGTEGDFIFGGKGNDILIGGAGADKFVIEPQSGNDRVMDFNIAEGDKLYFANFFSTPMTADAFVAKYVTDTGNDLLISLPGTSIVLVGVPSIGALAGAIAFGMPS